VLAYHEALDETGTYTVTDIISHQDQVTVDLTIAGERVDTTPEHAFYTEERGWVPAKDLQVGMHVLRLDGTAGVVQSVLLVEQPERMYNLSVAEAHTFFVGDQQWLVHNVNCKALANTAAYVHKQLPRNLRGSTVGASMGKNGRPILSVFERTRAGTASAVQYLRGRGWDVLDAPRGRTSAYHAERQLYRAGYTKIGISRQGGSQGGMCPSCSSFFSRRPHVTIRSYRAD
jgi:hypothetical protein